MTSPRGDLPSCHLPNPLLSPVHPSRVSGVPVSCSRVLPSVQRTALTQLCVCCYLIKPFLLPHFDSVPCRVGLIPGLLCTPKQCPPTSQCHASTKWRFYSHNQYDALTSNFSINCAIFSHLANRCETPLVSAGSCFTLFFRNNKKCRHWGLTSCM